MSLLLLNSVSAEIQAALERHEKDPSFRIVPLQLDSGAVPGGEIGDKLSRFQGLSVPNGDVQLAVTSIHQLLGPGHVSATDAERAARLKAELERAIAEKMALDKELADLKSKTTGYAHEKGALEEKVSQLWKEIEKASKKGEALKTKVAQTSRTSRRLRYLCIAAVVITINAIAGMAFFVMRETSDFQAQRDALRREVDGLQQQAGDLRQQVNDRQQQIDGLTLQIDEAKAEVARADMESKQRQEDLDKARAKLSDALQSAPRATAQTWQETIDTISASVDAGLSDLSWQTIRRTSWPRSAGIFGAKDYLVIDEGVYLWPVNISGGDRAEIAVNTSSASKEDGRSLYKGNLDLGTPVTFKSQTHEYRMRLFEISKANHAPTDALFLTVERRAATQERRGKTEQKTLQRQDTPEQKTLQRQD